MKPFTDRRSHERFDVVGAMWGILELSEPACIRNVSTSGALIDSPLPAILDSTQSVRVIVEGQAVTLDATVRHVRRFADETSAERYLVGLEFLSPPTSVVHSIEQLGAQGAQE